MGTILVTGATSPLGRPTVTRLRAAGHTVRALSRKREPGLVTGDLLTGVGIKDALSGVDVVVHLAGRRGRGDIALAKTLLEVGRAAGIGHLVFISIVGADRIPIAYYRAKVEVERLIGESSIPFSIQRSTQFHQLLDEIFRVQRFLPALLAPAVTLQPIAVEDVAERLTEIAESNPSGRVPDIGGPQQLSVPEFARAWRRARGTRRPVIPLQLPGKIFRAYSSGASLVDGPAYGRTTFDDYLATRFGGAA